MCNIHHTTVSAFSVYVLCSPYLLGIKTGRPDLYIPHSASSFSLGTKLHSTPALGFPLWLLPRQTLPSNLIWLGTPDVRGKSLILIKPSFVSVKWNLKKTQGRAILKKKNVIFKKETNYNLIHSNSLTALCK